MAYFEEALDYLICMDAIQSDKGIGVCGLSKGGEVALAMGATISPDKLGAIATMNTPLGFFGVEKVTYKGLKVCDAYHPPVPLPENCFKEIAPNLLNIFDLYTHYKLPQEAHIPFTVCKVPLLMIAGSDDQISPSVEQAKLGEKLMRQSGKSDFKIRIFEGLGHLIDLPYSPPTTQANHAMFPRHILIQMGGENEILHGQSQEKIWVELLDFFQRHL